MHPFNDIQTYEYSLKHAYAKRQWYRSNKKFEIKLINERLKYLANLFELSNRFKVENIVQNKKILCSLKIYK